MFEDLWAADIHVFHTAIRSAKWFSADRMPMKISTGSSGRGGTCQIGCFRSAKLARVVGNSDYTSLSRYSKVSRLISQTGGVS
jgi:hypothetical protein